MVRSEEYSTIKINVCTKYLVLFGSPVPNSLHSLVRGKQKVIFGCFMEPALSE